MATGIVRRLFLAAVLASSLPWVSAKALAAPPAAEERAESRPAGKVRIDAMDVYANQSGKVDPRLRDLERQLLGLNFTGFQLLGTHADTIGAGQTASFQVEGGRKVEVTLLSRTAEDARFQLEVFKDGEKKLDTTMTLKSGRYFITRLGKHEEGSLLFAVSVSE